MMRCGEGIWAKKKCITQIYSKVYSADEDHASYYLSQDNGSDEGVGDHKEQEVKPSSENSPSSVGPKNKLMLTQSRKGCQIWIDIRERGNVMIRSLWPLSLSMAKTFLNYPRLVS